jgi:hypothetical protein
MRAVRGAREDVRVRAVEVAGADDVRVPRVGVNAMVVAVEAEVAAVEPIHVVMVMPMREVIVRAVPERHVIEMCAHNVRVLMAVVAVVHSDHRHDDRCGGVAVHDRH